MTDAWRWMPVAVSLRVWRRALMLLLTALVLVQTVGVLHRVAHAQKTSVVVSHVSVDATGVLAAIWGDHSTSAECQLFDQACPDLLHTPDVAWSTSLPLAFGVAVLFAQRFALFARFYAARGPPVALI